MVKDRQVRRLLSHSAADSTLSNAAMRPGMDEKTARKYRDMGLFPSEMGSGPRTWRTRPDPFAAVWDSSTHHTRKRRFIPKQSPQARKFDWRTRRHTKSRLNHVWKESCDGENGAGRHQVAIARTGQAV